MQKPRCKLIGTDGNVFAIIGSVSKCLNKNGLKKEASEFQNRTFSSKSYDEVLQIVTEYVDAI